jgi:hypothetical protein
MEDIQVRLQPLSDIRQREILAPSQASNLVEGLQVGIIVEIHSEADLPRLVKEPDLHIVVYSRRMKISRPTKLGKLEDASIGISSVGLHVSVGPINRISGRFRDHEKVHCVG